MNAFHNNPEGHAMYSEDARHFHNNPEGHAMYSEDARQGECRETAASQLRGISESIVEKAAKVAVEANDRLSTISRSDPDIDVAIKPPADEWPPLFAALRSDLWRIEDSLRDIARSLSRIEV